ncbi:TPA: hypothetical protein TVN69_001842 [Streptococcus equi subsp. zooepidemicus]|nr:hypothetical protein [Streptococcus equi subsp. zooepidemicus]HEL1230635.1 hypothetical protein [Streptococcus equi subsp. zooepidemicus]
MKLTKTLCLVAATAALALAPINASNGQANTVLAMQTEKETCTPLGGGWYRCTDEQGRVFDTFDFNYQPPHRPSWLSWLFGAFFSAWSTLSGLFG